MKKILNHTLAEEQIVRYTTNCKANPYIDLESDYSCLVLELKNLSSSPIEHSRNKK